jgi:uncharacterized BrkB/YihY/UPF0761 family membrane protein
VLLHASLGFLIGYGSASNKSWKYLGISILIQLPFNAPLFFWYIYMLPLESSSWLFMVPGSIGVAIIIILYIYIGKSMLPRSLPEPIRRARRRAIRRKALRRKSK